MHPAKQGSTVFTLSASAALRPHLSVGSKKYERSLSSSALAYFAKEEKFEQCQTSWADNFLRPFGVLRGAK